MVPDTALFAVLYCVYQHCQKIVEPTAKKLNYNSHLLDAYVNVRFAFVQVSAFTRYPRHTHCNY